MPPFFRESRRRILQESRMTSNEMGEKKRVWLDCDPGHDDMLAIMLAGLFFCFVFVLFCFVFCCLLWVAWFVFCWGG